MSRRAYSLVLLAAVASLPVTIAAQDTVPNHLSTPNWELYGGYSYVFSDFGSPSDRLHAHGMNGWDMSLKVPLLGPYLGIKGDVSGVYDTDNAPEFNPRAYYFLLGPQVTIPFGRSRFWAHGLVGSSNVEDSALPQLHTTNQLAVAVGGGFDAGIGRRFAWRFAGDYYNTHWHQTSNTNSTISEILNSNGRISTGPVFRF
jgi:hypothetical protein